MSGYDNRTELEVFLTINGVKPASICNFGFGEEYKRLSDMIQVHKKPSVLTECGCLFLGRDKKSLSDLLEADSKTGLEKDYYVGIALGYPEEAVYNYIMNHNNSTLSWDYFLHLRKAKSYGIEPPKALAYISYVPEEFDLFEGILPEKSLKLGREYMTFTRRNKVGLANRIEEEFKEDLI